MSETHFSVAFSGEAVKGHTMDVRDLAPSLLSMGSMFDEANRVLNGDRARIKLHVRAVSHGCFEIGFLLDHATIGAIKDFLVGDGVTSAINLKEIVLGGAGLWWLIRKLRGKNPSRIDDLGNDMVRITHQGETIDVPMRLLRLYQDIAVRRAVSKTLEPLKRVGIDKLEVKDDGKVIESVTREEVDWFQIEQDEDLIVDEVQKAAYSIISLAFKEDNKWRLNDGQSTISATISDADFLRRVEESLESFSKNDVLICSVRKRQFRTDKGLKTEYEVEHVIDHLPAARQISMELHLPDDEANDRPKLLPGPDNGDV